MTTTLTETAKDTTGAGEGQGKTEAAKTDATGKTTEAKVETDKKADAPKTEDKPKENARVVPDKYDLKLPEGSQLDPSAVERHSSRAKELKMTNEEAQKELERDSDTVKSYVEGQKAQLKKQSDQWVKDSENDAEVGGAKFKENAELAKRALKVFDTKGDFSRFLDETGLGSHPEALRVFAKIGRAMGEDKLIHGGAGATGTKSFEDRLYGGTKE
jgi:hypothetical protein